MRAASLLAVSVLACLVLGSAAPRAAEPERVHLVSVYHQTPFAMPAQARVRRVHVTGRIGHDEVVWVQLDPNPCQPLGPMGDEGPCTEMAGWARQVTLKQTKLADPLKRGRSLYLLDDAQLEGKVSLVSADHDGHGWRVVLRDDAGQIARVLSLERRPMPPWMEEDE